MKHTHTLSRGLVLAGILCGLALGRAEAALTLTINPATKTYTWSGSATSADLMTPVGSTHVLRLGSGTWNGGSSSQGQVRLGVSYIQSSGGPANHVAGGIYGGILVATGGGTLSTNLGSIQAGAGEPPGSVGQVTVSVINSAPVSYAGFLAGDRAFIESLDGSPLFFQYWDGGGSFVNFGTSAGQIIVIPEPSSSSALLLLGACGLMRRRRRA